MARLETSGTRNCGLISLSCFSYAYPANEGSGQDSLQMFYSKLLDGYQPYACTKDMPLEELLKGVVEHKFGLALKTIQCAVTKAMLYADDGKLANTLKEYGFKELYKAPNSTGSVMHVWARIPEGSTVYGHYVDEDLDDYEDDEEDY